MADDWAPGDLALCVKSDDWRGADGSVTSGPAPGSISEVKALDFDPSEMCHATGRPYLGLVFADLWASYCSCAFTKINPLSDVERDAYTASLKRDEKQVAKTPVEVLMYPDEAPLAPGVW